jgi:uncharacterized lipoprotein YajG
MMLRRRAIICVGALLLLQACAFQHAADFVVPPPGARMRQPGAETVTLKVSVEDRRADKTGIGTGRSIPGDGSVWTMVLRRPLDAAIRDGVEAEFVARGYHLGDGPGFLLVDIGNAHADATYKTFRSHVSGNVSLVCKVLAPDGRQLYERRFLRDINVENRVLVGDWDEGTVELEKALASVIRDMAEDPALVQALMQADRHG